jgi:hypothetical protein
MRFARAFSRARSIVGTGGLVLALTAAVVAQRGGYGGRMNNPLYDGQFRFARIQYTVGQGGYYYGGMPSWAHGYPNAEENMVKILDSITDLHPHVDQSVVVAIDDPDFFKYPVSFMTEASFWIMSDAEGKLFREYLQKGGFVIFDDFRDDFRRGSGGLAQLESNLQRAIPGAVLVPMNPTDTIFHCFFDINSFDIIPQDYDRGRPVLLGLYEDNDPKKRLMAIINFNTDVSNFWEFSGQGLRPVPDTNEAYKLGVNYIIYGLTH